MLEGRHAVEGALAGWWRVEGVVRADGSGWEPAAWSGLELRTRSKAELGELAGYPFHRGVLGLARQPEETPRAAELLRELAGRDGLVVVCPRLANAANAGAILRNSAALGADAVIFGEEGVSPFDRKSVRASSGALFRLPVRVADAGQVLRGLKAGGFRIFGADGGPQAEELPGRQVGAGPLALVIGSEDEGLGGFWSAACDELLRIPMSAGVDSLNAAAASALLLWELGRLREAAREDQESGEG